MIHKISVKTDKKDEMLDLTALVKSVIKKDRLVEGTVTVYCPHTTAGLTINENADPDVVKDLIMRLNELFPWSHPGDRHGEGNSAAHLKASVMGFSQTLLVTEGELVLGTWQGLYFCEFDGPRNRTCYVKTSRDQIGGE